MRLPIGAWGTSSASWKRFKGVRMFGTKNRLTRDLANELLRPLNLTTKKLVEASKADIEKRVRDVVDRGKEQELYDRQTGWDNTGGQR